MKCVPSFMHKWQELYQTPEFTLEICERCKKNNVVRKDYQGRHEIRNYLKLHERDKLQKYEPRYQREYK